MPGGDEEGVRSSEPKGGMSRLRTSADAQAARLRPHA